MEIMTIITGIVLLFWIVGFLFLGLAFKDLSREYNKYRNRLEKFSSYLEEANDRIGKATKVYQDCQDFLEETKNALSNLQDSIPEIVHDEFDNLKNPKGGKEANDIGNLTRFDGPGEIFNGDKIHVLQALPNGNFIGKIINQNYDGEITAVKNIYVILKEQKEQFSFYDGEEIELPDDAVVFQIGTFQYSGFMGMIITLPAVEIFGLKERNKENKKQDGK